MAEVTLRGNPIHTSGDLPAVGSPAPDFTVVGADLGEISKDSLTGVRKTPPVKLVPLLIIGIIGRLILIWWLARTFEDQLVDLLEWIARYQWWVVAGSVGLVVLVNLKNFRRG